MSWTVTTMPDPEYVRQQLARAEAERVVAARGLEGIVAAASRRPGFFGRLRRRVAPLALGAGLFLSSVAGATQLAPLGAAHVNGAHGSTWRDRTQLRNPYNTPLTGELCVVPRGERYPDAAACEAYSLAPGTTVVYDDLWGRFFSTDGAGTVWVVPDEGQDDPLLFASVFNQDGEAEFGSTAQVLTPDDYAPAGTTLGTILSPEGYRDNPFVATGPDGATIEWTYTNSAGGNKVVVTAEYAPNTTVQYTGGVEQLLGFTPEPNASLDARILDGSARVYASSNNNTTNDNAIRTFKEYTPTQGAYDITVKINVSDNGQGFSQTTHPSETIIQKVWQVHDIGVMEGTHNYYCYDLPGGAVNSLDEIAHNYNVRLTPGEQQEFSGDRIGFQPFVNDSDFDGSVCDEDEPDHQFVTRVQLTITKR